MAYDVALHMVYNHYLTTYAPKTTSQYDTHKKSELRNIYNSIVKLNKESPLYLLDSSRESRAYAVGLKENARELRNTIASLGGLDETEMLGKKAAYSSDQNIASASYVGESNVAGIAPSFNIEVTALASNQVNQGTFLPSDEKAGLPPDTYSFNVAINDLNYEFQYNVRGGDTNRDVQERLARLISNADIGINADVLSDDKGRTSLRLASVATGVKNNKDYIFQISDEQASKQTGTIDYFGLDSLSQRPSNATFLLNGEPRTASSNHFTIDKVFEVTLNGVSNTEGETAEIGLKTDLDSLSENVNNLVHGYNSFVKAAAEYLDSHPRSGKLINEMNHISRHYQSTLGEIGITLEQNGQLAVDDSAFRHSMLNDESHSQLSTIRDFTNSVLRKTNQISLNPMEYVDKTLVAYKNPGHNFATPYVTSNYSGMLFNSYC